MLISLNHLVKAYALFFGEQHCFFNLYSVARMAHLLKQISTGSVHFLHRMEYREQNLQRRIPPKIGTNAPHNTRIATEKLYDGFEITSISQDWTNPGGTKAPELLL